MFTKQKITEKITTNVDPSETVTPQLKRSRAKRLGTTVVAATGLTVAIIGGLKYSGESPSRHENSTTTIVTEDTHDQETAQVRELQDLTGYHEKVPEQLKAQLRKSSVIIYRQPKGVGGNPEAFCNGNLLQLDDQVLVSTAVHCVDESWATQDALKTTQGQTVTVEIAGELPYVFSVYTAEGEFLSSIDAIAETAGEEHSELALMRPVTVSDEMQARALVPRFDAPEEGSPIYTFLASRAHNYVPQENSERRFIGVTNQYERFENLANAIQSHRPQTDCGPGSSGGGAIGVRGEFLGVLRTEIRLDDSRDTSDMWQERFDDVQFQTNINVKDSDVCQFGIVDQAVVAAQVNVLRNA